MGKFRSWDTSPCRGCGRPVVWVRALLKDGSIGPIPLDPYPPVYQVSDGSDGKPAGARLPNAMVSHFATCPQRDKMSKQGGRGPATRSPAAPVSPPLKPPQAAT